MSWARIGNSKGDDMKHDIATMKTVVKQVYSMMSKRQKQQIILVYAMASIGSVLEMLGVSVIIPLIQVISDPEQLLANEYVQLIMNWLGIIEINHLVLLIAGGVIIIYLLKNLYLLLYNYVQIRFTLTMMQSTANKIFSSYLCRPYEHFMNKNSAELLRATTNDVSSVYAIIDFLSKTIVDSLTIILICIFLFWINPQMAIGMGIILGITFLMVNTWMRRKLADAGQQVREAQFETNKHVYQATGGIKEINVKRCGDYFLNQYNKAYTKKRHAETRQRFLVVCPEKLIEAICASGFIIIVCIQILGSRESANFIAELAVFGLGAFRILPLVSRILGYITGIVFARPALESTYNELQAAEGFLRDREVTYEDKESDIGNSNLYEGIDEGIDISNISFQYPGSDNWVLKDASFKIHKNESVALIGASGAGKTTLADIILSLYTPQEGSIEVGGYSIQQIPNIWAKTVGYVAQSPNLMDESIRCNIAFGHEESEIDDARIWEVLEQAQLKEFVEGLPKQLETVIGERGVRFSGGQQQRIAIARALYDEPQVIILDEATSALDNETEAAVMQSIEMLQGKKTLIIIAHRLSTIQNCDRTFEIKDGKATEKM